MKFFSNREKRLSLSFLVRWILIAAGTALTAAGIVRLFMLLYTIITKAERASGLPLLVWPLTGALVCGLLIYRFCPDARGEGIPSYIHGLKFERGILPESITFFKYPAALSALASLGVGGLIGPLGRVNAGLLSGVMHKQNIVKVNEYDIRNATICGLAAVTGILTHSGIGSGIFAVEIIQRANLRYRDLFPSILAGSFAALLARSLDWEPVFSVIPEAENFSWTILPLVVLVAILGGLCGKLYISIYRKTAVLLKRDSEKGIVLKVVAGTAAASLLAWLIHPELLGTSKVLVEAVLQGQSEQLFRHLPAAFPVFAVLLIFMLVKMTANCITVGSGMSAGFTAPSAICGIFAGAAIAWLFGIEAGSAEYTTLVCAGFAAVLASVMNVPLAAAVFCLELFGIHSGPAGAIAALLAFQINRQDTIYDERYPGC